MTRVVNRGRAGTLILTSGRSAPPALLELRVTDMGDLLGWDLRGFYSNCGFAHKIPLTGALCYDRTVGGTAEGWVVVKRRDFVKMTVAGAAALPFAGCSTA